VLAPNGYTFAAVVNYRPADDDFAYTLMAELQKVINEVSAWPGYDLF
jgi:hypothetical protein